MSRAPGEAGIQPLAVTDGPARPRTETRRDNDGGCGFRNVGNVIMESKYDELAGNIGLR